MVPTSEDTYDHEDEVEDTMLTGVWPGAIERSEGYIIATPEGIVKCRRIRRRPEGEQWDVNAILNMKRTTWQPTPGSNTDHISTVIPDKEGNANGRPAKVQIELEDKTAFAGR